VGDTDGLRKILNYETEAYKKPLSWRLALSASAVAQQPVPNFIIFIADDVSWDDLGCYGNPVVKTPNIDRLAQEGLKFTNAFLTASSSSPSRCSIISGRYPHSNGQLSFILLFRRTKYHSPCCSGRTGIIPPRQGKWHFGPSVHRAFDRHTDGNGYSNDGNGGERITGSEIYKGKAEGQTFFLLVCLSRCAQGMGCRYFQNNT
jgi:arylsulfatase A-like enzyme